MNVVLQLWQAVRSWWRRAVWETWLVSGVLLGVGLITDLWWLTIIGVALFVAAVDGAATRGMAAWGGWVAFSVKSLFALGWFWSTYPLDWLVTLPPIMQITSIALYWVTTALALGAGGAAAGWGIWSVLRRVHFWGWWVLLAALVWVAAEVLGSFVFSVVLWGAGGGFNIQFGLGYIGYVLSEHPLLLSFAAFGGVYGLTVAAALLGIGLWVLARNAWVPRSKLLGVGVVLVVLVSTSAWLTQTRPAVGDDVAVVHTNFKSNSLTSESRFASRNQELQAGVAAAVAAGASHIVLPEDARLTVGLGSTSTTLTWLTEQVGDRSVVVMDSTRVDHADGTATLRGLIYDTAQARVWQTDKQYLVPQGEFMPYLHAFLLHYYLGPDAIEQVAQQVSYRPGVRNPDLPTYVPGVLFCFTSIDPLGVQRLVNERAVDWVAHPVSHAWFGTPTGLWKQLDRMITVHEEWHGVRVITAANDGDPRLWADKAVIHDSERVRVVWAE